MEAELYEQVVGWVGRGCGDSGGRKNPYSDFERILIFFPRFVISYRYKHMSKKGERFILRRGGMNIATGWRGRSGWMGGPGRRAWGGGGRSRRSCTCRQEPSGLIWECSWCSSCWAFAPASAGRRGSGSSSALPNRRSRPSVSQRREWEWEWEWVMLVLVAWIRSKMSIREEGRSGSHREACREGCSRILEGCWEGCRRRLSSPGCFLLGLRCQESLRGWWSRPVVESRQRHLIERSLVLTQDVVLMQLLCSSYRG